MKRGLVNKWENVWLILKDGMECYNSDIIIFITLVVLYFYAHHPNEKKGQNPVDCLTLDRQWQVEAIELGTFLAK
jgi:hypothetical protein